MIVEWLLLVFGTAFALLPIVNPISTAPIFLALSQGFSVPRREQQARMAAIWMAVILLVPLIAGALVLEFFGISLLALRFAGGLVVSQIGTQMMQAQAAASAVAVGSATESAEADDIAFSPVAMPMLSGPGSIAVAISMATEVTRPSEYLAVALGILIVSFVVWLFLRGAARMGEILGSAGVNALNRLMGFLLICIGVQFMGTAVLQALAQVAEVISQAQR